MQWLEGSADAMGMNLGKLWEMVRTERPDVQESMRSQRIEHIWETEQQQQLVLRLWAKT